MKNQEIVIAAKYIREYVSYDVCNDTITNGRVKKYCSYSAQKTTYSAVNDYLLWLINEIDDETAMKYLRKPSPDLPDDAVIAVFYTNVWNRLAGRKQWEERIRKQFDGSKHDKKHPLCITMSICRGYENEEDAAIYFNGFFQLLVSRVSDKSLVEIVNNAEVSLPDKTILLKIYGDIWKNGPLFRTSPDE